MASRDHRRQPSDLVDYGVGVSGQSYNKGSALMVDTSGVLQHVAIGSGNRFLGVIDEDVIGANGVNGLSVGRLQAWKTGEFDFLIQGSGASTDIGKVGYFTDEETVGNSYGANAMEAGEIVGLVDENTYRVRITNSVGKTS